MSPTDLALAGYGAAIRLLTGDGPMRAPRLLADLHVRCASMLAVACLSGVSSFMRSGPCPTRCSALKRECCASA